MIAQMIFCGCDNFILEGRNRIFQKKSFAERQFFALILCTDNSDLAITIRYHVVPLNYRDREEDTQTR